MNIAIGLILFSQLKSLLLHGKITKNFTSFAIYMDDIFGAFKTYQKQYIFLNDHFFSTYNLV